MAGRDEWVSTVATKAAFALKITYYFCLLIYLHFCIRMGTGEHISLFTPVWYGPLLLAATMYGRTGPAKQLLPPAQERERRGRGPGRGPGRGGFPPRRKVRAAAVLRGVVGRLPYFFLACDVTCLAAGAGHGSATAGL